MCECMCLDSGDQGSARKLIWKGCAGARVVRVHDQETKFLESLAFSQVLLKYAQRLMVPTWHLIA